MVMSKRLYSISEQVPESLASFPVTTHEQLYSLYDAKRDNL